MAGNVWEWTSSLYMPYPYRAEDGREDLNASGERVKRGGSWVMSPTFLRSASRIGFRPSDQKIYLGFRCAQDAEK
jgi:formylglycine-generating enzyme required for sulfatase activity